MTKVETVEVTVSLPKIKSIKYNIKLKKNKITNFLPAGSPDIPIEWRNDFHYKFFMWYDCTLVDSSDLTFLFQSLNTLFFENLKQVWLRTFRYAPPNFYQLLNIRCSFLGRAYPIVYILLNNKTQESRFKAFEEVKRNIWISASENCRPWN